MKWALTTMAPELKEICGYLRDVLNFRDYIEIPDNKDSYFYISDDELKTGALEMKEDRLRLLGSWSAKGKGDITESTVDVILIPKIVSDIVPKYTSARAKDGERVWEYKRTGLLYIKASIDKETFRIKSKTGETVVWADPLTVKSKIECQGLIGKFLNKFFKSEDKKKEPKFSLKDASPPVCGDESWTQYIDEVDDYFRKRTGRGLFKSDTLRDENGESHNLYVEDAIGQTVVVEDNTVFAAMHIVSLLKNIEEKADVQLPLMEKMILGNNTDKRLNCHILGENVDRHLGQMKNQFPLADAQRDVVHCSVPMREGDVLAVSGPPGTGKTTLLQSIVADMVVRYVVHSDGNKRADNAPLILASSSNNKAITNIIDAFSGGDEDTSSVGLHHRWICYATERGERFVPMAVYCPSNYVGKRKMNEYFMTDTGGSQHYGALRDRYYRDSADFYDRAQKALGINATNVDEVIEALKVRITDLYQELNEIGNIIRNKNTSRKIFAEIVNGLAIRCENVSYAKKIATDSDPLANPDIRKAAEAIDLLLDMTLRHDLYWLAVHHNECVWINEIEKYRKGGKGLKKVYGKYLWDEIKYICPCVVSTFYRAPKLFEYTPKNGQKTYNYRLADLLIVDEAGQVSPEVGLPTFALAKKALVVGDVKQIPPVYGIPECSEETYWTKRVVSKQMQSRRELLSCCRSSIMAVAESRCDYERETGLGGKTPGLFLNEHRRCVDEIIAYSNELVYGGDLVPKRGSYRDNCRLVDIPPIGFHPVDGTCDIKDGSRFNRKEIDVIAKWLRSNASRIEDAYSDDNKKRPIHELVSIITPFKAQSSLIKEDGYLKYFPCGTVHTFQGAESPIVIFSLVYGKSDNPVFIKSNHELMNVAVSRAKDHFLIFGNRECIDRHLTDQACFLLHIKSVDI